MAVQHPPYGVLRVRESHTTDNHMGGKAAGCGGGGDLQLGGQHGGHQSWGTNWSDNLKKAVCEHIMIKPEPIILF